MRKIDLRRFVRATRSTPREINRQILLSLVREHGGVGRCEGIGLVVPGMVDQKTGRVLNSPQLGWRDVDVRDAVAAGTGLPVYIENAPIACALAHMWLGQHGAEPVSDFAY